MLASPTCDGWWWARQKGTKTWECVYVHTRISGLREIAGYDPTYGHDGFVGPLTPPSADEELDV